MVFYKMIAYEDDLGQTTSGTVESKKTEKQEKEEDGKKGRKKNAANGHRPSFRYWYGNWLRDEHQDPAILKNHRVTDWQNVALIWDKFMMIMMALMTGTALAIVSFLYVVEVSHNDVLHNDGLGMDVEPVD